MKSSEINRMFEEEHLRIVRKLDNGAGASREAVMQHMAGFVGALDVRGLLDKSDLYRNKAASMMAGNTSYSIGQIMRKQVDALNSGGPKAFNEVTEAFADQIVKLGYVDGQERLYGSLDASDREKWIKYRKEQTRVDRKELDDQERACDELNARFPGRIEKIEEA